MQFFTPDGKEAGGKRLQKSRGEFLTPDRPRAEARFRVSIKDKLTGAALKVELVEACGFFGGRRQRIRVNGREGTKVKVATLTEVFGRLRAWTDTQAARME